MNPPIPAETQSLATDRYKKVLALTAAVGTLALPQVACSTEPTRVHTSGAGDCLRYFEPRYHNHEYEVCTAYIVNSAEIALQAFYKFGNNRSRPIARASRHHFETRYWAAPRRAIERRVDAWPKTRSPFGNRVEEQIDLVSLHANLKADHALLHTHESWQVTSRNRTLHTEADSDKNITMCRGRLPGLHLLHEWFVVSYARQPKFDCIGFDRRHDIKP